LFLREEECAEDQQLALARGRHFLLVDGQDAAPFESDIADEGAGLLGLADWGKRAGDERRGRERSRGGAAGPAAVPATGVSVGRGGRTRRGLGILVAQPRGDGADQEIHQPERQAAEENRQAKPAHEYLSWSE